MPNTFTDHRDRWLQMSEVDYLGQFVKAWLAFNAWYRSSYAETHDGKIIEEIKWKTPSPIGSKFRPLLLHHSEEAEQFRTEIGLLHHRLERYELHSGKGDEKTRIRLSQIVIRTEPPIAESGSYRSWEYRVERISNGNVTFEITKPDGNSHLSLTPHHFDVSQLETHPDFQNIGDGVKSRCIACYNLANPRVVRDLTEGDYDPISCGTHQFCCGPDFLFAGVIETIYRMRCSLFHGELVPTREAAECYEPAYRMVRRFLESIT